MHKQELRETEKDLLQLSVAFDFVQTLEDSGLGEERCSVWERVICTRKQALVGFVFGYRS